LIDPQVLDALRRAVGEKWVKTTPAQMATYASDGLPTRHAIPGAVVHPASKEEVIKVIKILAHHGVAFVARGAGTGLSGGALAESGSVSLVLTRMNKLLSIDPINQTATVEPGVVNARLSTATAPHGLLYAPDPSSQTACTLGGNIAENAGGPHCLKYGTTTNHVLELDIVLPNGETTTLGNLTGEPNGPDLRGLFIGSEGMFGVATSITVRLLPIPTSIHTLLADFDSLRAAGEAVSAIIASGVVPAALEMIDRYVVQAVENSIYAAGYPTDAEAILLVELDGPEEIPVKADVAAVRELLDYHGARSITVANDPQKRARLWQGRKKAFGALGRISPDLVVQDAVVPRTALPDVLETIVEIGRKYQLVVSNVFHAGDGNLHPNINFDSSDPDELERTERASAEIMAACIAAGGTITGEHGVGIDKLKYMTQLFDANTLTAMRGVRRAFDPAGIANPGKVVPIHACREWWAAPGQRT
jgi:glycolate oxidase subunit GlcD